MSKGHHPAGDRYRAEIKHRRAVEQRIEQSHRHHERKHDAQFVKAGAHRDAAHLKQNHGDEHHHGEAAELVFMKRDRHDDVGNRRDQFCERTQPVDWRVLRCERIHLGQLVQRLFHLVHTGSLT